MTNEPLDDFQKRSQKVALSVAKQAYEENFSRLGVVYCEDVDVLVLYDNVPWKSGSGRRERQLTEFRRALRAKGLEELGFATYPTEGEQKGHTVAMVINASVDMREWVITTYEDSIARVLKQLEAEK